MYRDLEELLRFQQEMERLGWELQSAAARLAKSAAAAQLTLRDRVGKNAIGRITEIASALNAIGRETAEDMRAEKKKTIDQINRFNSL